MEKIFQKVVEIVSEHTGAQVEQIKSDKHEEFVNYRIILINALSKVGFSDSKIACKIGMTRQGVNFLKSKLDCRLKHNRVLSSIWQEISKELASNQFISK